MCSSYLRTLTKWRLAGAFDVSVVSDDMLKAAFQIAEEYIGEQLRVGLLEDGEMPPLTMTAENSTESCPYKLTNIHYPTKTTFTVEIADQDNNLNSLNIHPNIQVLLNRMENELSRDDYSGVLHASASVFETMAKDITGIPAVQNQTLKGFFERYRQDSSLPDEILDYILDVYESRNTSPLAGHGSTQQPNISKRNAIVLSEITKALVKIEYRSFKR